MWRVRLILAMVTAWVTIVRFLTFRDRRIALALGGTARANIREEKANATDSLRAAA